jgi:CheY-like chemotaxis protein
MPEMNGIEVARAVLARDPDIPVLYVTGYADLSALGNVGEDMIVKKPFRNEEFVAKVKRLLPKQPRNKGNSGSRRAATRR